MRILLTGACGYVGSALLPKLIAAGHQVESLDIGWFGGEPTHKVDVRLVTAIKDIDCIIHLAAIANDPSVAFYPRLSWETSALATQQLCQMAVTSRCNRFIYASSVSVYGADRGLVTEGMDLWPLSDYNKTKMVTERVLLSYADMLNVQIIRPATVCGLSPRMRLDLTVNMLTMQALTKGVITLHGGAQMRPSIHIDDMCDLYLFMLAHDECRGIYNAGFENATLREIAQKVDANVPCKIEVTGERDVRSYQVNSERLLATGFRPKSTIDDAIKELVSAYAAGSLKDEPRARNLEWMQHLGIKDA